MIPGQIRDFKGGITVYDGDIRVRVFPNCITLSANSRMGWAIMNIFQAMKKYIDEASNTVVYRDGVGDIHSMEIHFVKESVGGNNE